MAKAKVGAKKATPVKKPAVATKPKAGLLKSASKGVASAAAKLVKAAQKIATPEPKAAAKTKSAKVPPVKPPAKEAAVKEAPAKASPKVAPVKAVAAVAEKIVEKAEKVEKAPKAPKAPKVKGSDVPKVKPPPPMTLSPFDVKPDKPLPRATKLPNQGEPLTKRETEQLLTAGAGRGVLGEGSLKGRLLVKDGFPYLQVIGRDKRELSFLLQGPDQEVLPAYQDHKVSVSGMIRKTTNYGGIVDVRKYSAKKPEAEVVAEPLEQKLRYLSPGEVEQVQNAGMGAGMHGFATVRGSLEMSGDEFFLVAANGGTRHQVSFLLQGKGAKGLRKLVGSLVNVTGVVDKSSGWGGIIETESVEARPVEFRAVSRDNMDVVEVEQPAEGTEVEVKLNHGLSVRLSERAGYTWAIEPTTAKRLSLREANFEMNSGGNPPTREFFFTPRNPGSFEIEFFLAKVYSPAQVMKTLKLVVHVKA